MSDEHSPIDEFAPEGGRRRKERSRLPGCLAVLVALALVVGGFYFAVTKGVDFVRDQFADPRLPGARQGPRHLRGGVR